MHPYTHYEHVAKLFDYPRRDYPNWVQGVYELLAGRYVLAAAHVAAFASILPTEGEPFSQDALDEVQEIFTRSFDVQAITTLSIGYLMFGDDYRRAELLVNLAREQAATGVDCGSELADHLPNVLRLLARWEDRILAEEFVVEILHPSIEKMIDEFGTHRMAVRDEMYQKHYRTLIVTSPERGTMFLDPLCAVLEMLRVDFPLTEYRPDQAGNDFLRGIERELEIEAGDFRPARPGRLP